jgi:hypothetical protein
MLIVYKLAQPFTKQSQVIALLKQFGQFNARIGAEHGGGYSLVVPAGRRPLAVLRQLKVIEPSARWHLYGLDDEGNPVVPIVAEQP